MKNRVLSVMLMLCLVVGCLASSQNSKAKTYKADNGKTVTLKGKIKKVKTELDQRKFTQKYATVYVLVLDKKITVKNDLGKEKVKELQIWNTTTKNQKKKLKQKVGKKVKVKGKIINMWGGSFYTNLLIDNVKIL